MNRRNFTQAAIGTVGVSLAVGPLVAKTKNRCEKYQKGMKMRSDDGLNLVLKSRDHATIKPDDKQFILTFEVNNPPEQLDEKIYHLIDEAGKKHQIHMKPVSPQQLQANFNWRTYG
ncbi:hypothetical protein OS175_11375 [Marinicella sp. S1101]|uniref:hypothetical protein n=1 Tax=Marinicella marina TaxID=2996016 RepID=UPI002260BED1|nr:hypothetical protein [Marinicella marina]MCX7554485.1 hypothetical protein [Marinicella marina]MDJ1140636.1 hypothetical protein [Marinicella marina]